MPRKLPCLGLGPPINSRLYARRSTPADAARQSGRLWSCNLQWSCRNRQHRRRFAREKHGVAFLTEERHCSIFCVASRARREVKARFEPALRWARGVHKFSRVPNLLDLQEDRVTHGQRDDHLTATNKLALQLALWYSRARVKRKST